MPISPQNHSGSRNNVTADSGGPSSPGRAGDGESIKDKAGTLAGEATSEGQAKVDEMRATAADKIETLADSVKAAAAELKSDDIGHLSDYVSDLAQSLGQLSSNMREKTGDDLLHEVSRLARDNPALFVTGSIAIGFGLSRFAKASTPAPDTGVQRDADTDRHSLSPGSGDATASRATSAAITPTYSAQTPTSTSSIPVNTSGSAAQQYPGTQS